MRKTMIHFATITALACSSFIVSAGEEPNKEKQLEHGNKMHSEHCYKCHTDKVYTRDNHFVKSLDALGKQVVRCKDNTGVPWFDEDTAAVVHFLNEKYYKF
jgi:hypothetical protein